MDQGTVKWFSNKKGYGFIEREVGDDLFVHYSDIGMEGYKSIKQGEGVQYTVEASDRGPVAKNVSVISAAPEQPKEAAAGN